MKKRMEVNSKLLPMSDEWRERLDNLQKGILQASPSLCLLKERLLSFGGHHACMPCVEDDYKKIMERGRIFSGRGAILKKGRVSGCHHNAANLWDVNQDILSICTGYYLTKDGVWRQHSWCFHRPAKKVVETTNRAVIYYGFEMTPEESEQFVLDNWL